MEQLGSSEDEVGHMFHSPFWAVIFPTSTLQKYSIVSTEYCAIAEGGVSEVLILPLAGNGFENLMI